MKKIITISVVWLLCLTGCGGGSGTNSDAVIGEEIAKGEAIKLAAESLEADIGLYSEEYAECLLEGILEIATDISWEDLAETLERDGNLEDLNSSGAYDEVDEEDAVALALTCATETDVLQSLMDEAVEDVISNSGEGGNYGDDPYLDSLYDQCADGDNQACDDLFLESPGGSEYEAFGIDCGGRWGLEERRTLLQVCEASSSGEGGNYGDDPVLDDLYDQCADGDNQACDDLFWQSPSDSEYEAFGLDCGGRGGLCETSSSDEGGNYGDDPYLDSLYDQCADGDNQACDDLFLESPGGSEYEAFGSNCGGRGGIDDWCSSDTFETDIPFFYGEDDFLDNLYDQCADGNDEACDDLFWQSVGGSEYGSFALTCGGRGCQIPMDGRSMNYGDNAYLDNLYDQCADGNDQACNDLYFQSFGGSEYEEFALTCGGRGCQIPG